MSNGAPLVRPAGKQETELYCNSKEKVTQLMNTLYKKALKDKDRVTEGKLKCRSFNIYGRFSIHP